MPSFSGTFHPDVGPLIEVAIVPFTESKGSKNAKKNNDVQLFKALIDTGATSTCLSGTVIDALDLKPVGQTPVIGVTGRKIVNQFVFSVGFFQPQRQHSDGRLDGRFAWFPIRGLQFDQESTATYQVLLGRDILCKGVFSMSFDGHWLFSF
ncbi:MAG: hypothetical protein GDA55_08700 [Cellvibrionales bacterium]|nr:hypothetical protein [Cellvibrionales bacterium]